MVKSLRHKYPRQYYQLNPCRKLFSLVDVLGKKVFLVTPCKHSETVVSVEGSCILKKKIGLQKGFYPKL